MRKIMLVVMMSAMLVGCGRGEAPVPTLDSPQPKVLEETILMENILEENIEYENVTTWDDATTYWEDVD